MSKSNLDFIEINSDRSVIQTLSQKVDEGALSLVYRQAKHSLIASFFCATIILAGLNNRGDNSALYLWYAFAIAVISFRSLLLFAYARQKKPLVYFKFWQRIFVCGACLGGLTWGLTGSFLFSHFAPPQQMLVILIIAGTTAGSVPGLSGVLSAAIGFLLFAIVPMIVSLLFVKTDISIFFDLTVVAYLGYLISLVYRTNSIMIHSIALQFENTALLSNLYKAKDQLEVTNIQLEQAATHDPLTNAANRNLFTANFQLAIDRAKEHKTVLALLYIDLDNFKEVNDRYGHYVGDQLLLGIINRLEALCKNNDNISRLGGDEFTVVLENIKNTNEAARVSRLICQAIAQPIQIDDIEIKVSASIGISIYPNDGAEPEVLLQNADRSMYFVKQRGGNNFLFNGEMFMN